MDADKKEPNEKAKGKAKTKTNEGVPRRGNTCYGFQRHGRQNPGWMEDTVQRSQSMLEPDKIRDEMGVEKPRRIYRPNLIRISFHWKALEISNNWRSYFDREGAPTTMGDEVPDDDMDMEPDQSLLRTWMTQKQMTPQATNFSSDAGVGGEEEADSGNGKV